MAHSKYYVNHEISSGGEGPNTRVKWREGAILDVSVEAGADPRGGVPWGRPISGFRYTSLSGHENIKRLPVDNPIDSLLIEVWR
jgi:hypothetical protein